MFLESYRGGPDTDNLLDTPLILQEVQAARSSELRLDSLHKLGKELLSDLPGYDEVIEKVIAASKDAKAKRQQLVDSWVMINYTGRHFLDPRTRLYFSKGFWALNPNPASELLHYVKS